MLRCARWCLKLKRHRSPYVHKYLEGCPLPETLVDDLAGANLKSSTPFFSTSPRYIVPGAEKRLSRLFFHHSLYPAGGARQVYRVMVIRGARGVRRESGAHISHGRDPARRPFFYTRANQTRGNPIAPHRTQWKGNATDSVGCREKREKGEIGVLGMSIDGRVEERMRTKRPNEDTVLAPLCGVVEEHFAQCLKERVGDTTSHAEGAQEGDASMGETGNGERGAQEAFMNALASLLSGMCGGIVSPTMGSSSGASSSWSHPLSSLLRAASVGCGESYLYVHTHLPPSAVLTRSLRSSEETVISVKGELLGEKHEKRVVHQLAGGLEPMVSFAVGTPLPVRRANGEWRPFGHIQCLLRVNTRSTLREAVCTKTTNATETRRHAPSNASHGTGIVEPWKLGTSLDPMVPFHVRTMSEKLPNTITNVTTSETDALGVEPRLGREDCETYLIPQRELLLRVEVPKEVMRRCAEQNEERRRRQAQMGYGHPKPYFAEVPRNAHTVLEGQYRNHLASEVASAASIAAHTSSGNEETHEEEENDLGVGERYEIRALPGDVLFIPRGWTYTVQRVVGLAVLNTVATNPNASTHGGVSEMERQSRTVRKAFVTPSQKEGITETKYPASAKGDVLVEFTGVEVDAFVLCYKPYPILSKEQAATYVAANYVQTGIDEFYANGGNNVYHRYT